MSVDLRLPWSVECDFIYDADRKCVANCDSQEVAEALGIPVERIERDMWGCDTCGYGSTVLVLGWASEEDLRCLPKIPIEPKTWPTSVIYEVGRTRTVVTTSEDGTVCVSKEAVITETFKPRY